MVVLPAASSAHFWPGGRSPSRIIFMRSPVRLALPAPPPPAPLSKFCWGHRSNAFVASSIVDTPSVVVIVVTHGKAVLAAEATTAQGKIVELDEDRMSPEEYMAVRLYKALCALPKIATLRRLVLGWRQQLAGEGRTVGAPEMLQSYLDLIDPLILPVLRYLLTSNQSDLCGLEVEEVEVEEQAEGCRNL